MANEIVAGRGKLQAAAIVAIAAAAAWISPAPAGTPPAIVNRIHAEVVKGLQHAEGQAFMRNQGAEPVGSSPAEFTAFVAREIEKYARIVKLSGAKPDS